MFVDSYLPTTCGNIQNKDNHSEHISTNYMWQYSKQR